LNDEIENFYKMTKVKNWKPQEWEKKLENILFGKLGLNNEKKTNEISTKGPI
jgi:DNA polymerase I-like protein with 3'-5' exonuclease and polymerase domains